MKLFSSHAVVSTALLCSASAMASPFTPIEKTHYMTTDSTTSSTLLRSVNPTGTLIPGISQAVIVSGGRTMYLSGHVPLSTEGKVPAGMEAQLVLAFENLNATLMAAGATARNLARISIYVRDFHADQLPVIRQVRVRFIDESLPPASALIGVAELFHPDVLVEVDAIAVLPPTN